MRCRSKVTAKVIVLVAVIVIVPAYLSSIPDGTPYFDGESGGFTQVVLRQGDAHQGWEVTIDDLETVAAISDYLDRFTYSYRAPFYNGLTMTLVLEGEGNTQYYCLSPYGIVNQQEHFVYNNDQPYFQPLFDLLKETQ